MNLVISHSGDLGLQFTKSGARDGPVMGRTEPAGLLEDELGDISLCRALKSKQL